MCIQKLRSIGIRTVIEEDLKVLVFTIGYVLHICVYDTSFMLILVKGSFTLFLLFSIQENIKTHELHLLSLHMLNQL